MYSLQSNLYEKRAVTVVYGNSFEVLEMKLFFFKFIIAFMSAFTYKPPRILYGTN